MKHLNNWIIPKNKCPRFSTNHRNIRATNRHRTNYRSNLAGSKQLCTQHGLIGKHNLKIPVPGNPRALHITFCLKLAHFFNMIQIINHDGRINIYHDSTQDNKNKISTENKHTNNEESTRPRNKIN